MPGPKRDYIGYGRYIPKVRWPNNARVGLNIVLNYEEGSEYTHPAGDKKNDGLTEIPVVLENNNEHLTQRSAERLPLFRALLSPRQEVVLVSCLWVGPGAPESAGVQSVRPSAW